MRSWTKYKIRVTMEAIVGAVTGSLTAPRTVMLGRYDRAGRSQYTGRSATLSQAAGRSLSQLLTPPPGRIAGTGGPSAQGGEHRAASTCAWCSPRLSWRSPSTSPASSRAVAPSSRTHRVRTDLDAAHVPLFGE